MPSRERALGQIDSTALRSYLIDTLRDEQSLSVIARNSYTHQLGFEKFLLSPSDTNLIWVRVHFWPDSMSGRDTDIHSHCASFTSTILTGELSSLTYERSEIGSEFYEYEYCFDVKLGKSSAFFKKKSILQSIINHKFTAGSVYSLPANELHQTVDVAKDTVTLSIWGSRNQTASVFRNIPVSNGSDIRRSGMSLEYASTKLQQIIDILDN